MQARQTAERQALSSLSEARNRMTAIAAIHELLYLSGSFSEVDLAAYARRAPPHLAVRRELPHRRIGRWQWPYDRSRPRRPVGLPLNELLHTIAQNPQHSRARSAMSSELPRSAFAGRPTRMP